MIEQINRLYATALSIDAIAKKFNISAFSIYDKVTAESKKERNISLKNKGMRFELIDEQVMDMQQMIEDGAKILDVAQIYGVAKSTVTRSIYKTTMPDEFDKSMGYDFKIREADVLQDFDLNYYLKVAPPTTDQRAIFYIQKY